MYISTEIITPERATQLLKTQKQNRLPNKHHVAFLAEQMAQGLWMSNTGDTIKLNTKGNLIDGQHRLLAIVKAGMHLEVAIANNVVDEAVQVLDTGRSRTAVDAATIAGLPSSNNLLSAVRCLISIQNGTIEKKREKLPTRVILDWIHNNPRAIESYHTSMVLFGKSHLYSLADYLVLHFLFERSDAGLCKRFFEKFTTGLELTATDPVYLLREKMQRYREGRYEFARAERIALAIKAWNWMKSGDKTPMPKLVYSPDKEDFPTVK